MQIFITFTSTAGSLPLHRQQPDFATGMQAVKPGSSPVLSQKAANHVVV
ncbi:hypothetical protein ABMC30_06690 [Comamonas kerstersii]|nr:hypothetical protein [Comamonas kerstersii]